MERRGSRATEDEFKASLAVKKETLGLAEAEAARQMECSRLQDLIASSSCLQDIIGPSSLAFGAAILGVAPEILDDVSSQELWVTKAQANLINMSNVGVSGQKEDNVVDLETGGVLSPAAKIGRGDLDTQCCTQNGNVSLPQDVSEVFDDMPVRKPPAVDGVFNHHIGEDHLLEGAEYAVHAGGVLAGVAFRQAAGLLEGTTRLEVTGTPENKQPADAVMGELGGSDGIGVVKGAEGVARRERDLRLDGLSVGTLVGNEKLYPGAISAASPDEHQCEERGNIAAVE